MSDVRQDRVRNVNGAVFSPCRTWRYVLTRDTERALELDALSQVRARQGSGLPRELLRSTVAFIGLNPSTADEVTNDRTVAKCVRYAQRWGFERMVMLNIFAYRSTDPKVLHGGVRFPPSYFVGPENNRYVVEEAEKADLVVCAWGTHGVVGKQGHIIESLLRARDIRLHTFGLTRDGYPKHPLYLRDDAELLVFE